MDYTIRWPDLIVLFVGFILMLVIGTICARRNKSAETYFLAGRRMSGWIVGFSMMATIISSMSFLANPGSAYQGNWKFMTPTVGYFIALILALFIFIPHFRKMNISSIYEYLELRFGAWARFYSAAGFLLMQIFRIGIILYAASLAIQAMTGWPMPFVIALFGIIVALYTVAGGLEAVIWTDVIQAIALIGGAFICLPVIINHLPGGFNQIIADGIADNKFSLGDPAWDFSRREFWTLLFMSPLFWIQLMCTDQSMMQRYCAPKTLREARKSMLFGAALTVPMWAYFFFIGTAIYVFYQANPTPELQNLEGPEQILPFFILREVPAGLAGFVILGLVASAMSTLDSLVNATAATLTNDFYKRIVAKKRDDRHYLRMGRIFSVLFSVIMIITALTIHWSRSQTLNDIQTLAYSIFGGGLLGLFMLGLLTRRVDNIVALISTITTVVFVSLFLIIDSTIGEKLCPALKVNLPDGVWLGTLANIFIFCLGLILTKLFNRRSKKNLENLTVWKV